MCVEQYWCWVGLVVFFLVFGVGYFQFVFFEFEVFVLLVVVVEVFVGFVGEYLYVLCGVQVQWLQFVLQCYVVIVVMLIQCQLQWLLLDMQYQGVGVDVYFVVIFFQFEGDVCSWLWYYDWCGFVVCWVQCVVVIGLYVQQICVQQVYVQCCVGIGVDFLVGVVVLGGGGGDCMQIVQWFGDGWCGGQC